MIIDVQTVGCDTIYYWLKCATMKLVKEKDKSIKKNEAYLRIFKYIKQMDGRNTELVC